MLLKSKSIGLKGDGDGWWWCDEPFVGFFDSPGRKGGKNRVPPLYYIEFNGKGSKIDFSIFWDFFEF